MAFHPIITILRCNRRWNLLDPGLADAPPNLPEWRGMTTDIEQNSRARGLPPKRPEESYQRARRHSRRVGLLKIGLPAGAVFLVAVFGGWAYWSTPQGFTVDVVGSAVKDGKLVMANPKLNGFTRDNLPYAMTAERAVQDLTDTTKIKLENIDARLPIEAESWADIDAKDGIFDNENSTLDVTSPMTITTSDGMIALLKSAFVEMDTGRITTTEPVSLELNGSTLHADTMTVENRGSVVVFENRVRMFVQPDKLRKKDGDE